MPDAFLFHKGHKAVGFVVSFLLLFQNSLNEYLVSVAIFKIENGSMLHCGGRLSMGKSQLRNTTTCLET